MWDIIKKNPVPIIAVIPNLHNRSYKNGVGPILEEEDIIKMIPIPIIHNNSHKKQRCLGVGLMLEV
jgi:hypothetical protein